MPKSPFLIALALWCAAPRMAVADPGTTGGTVTGRVLLVKEGSSVTPVDVFVYLEEVRPKHRKDQIGDGVKAQIRQQDKNFIPHAIVVPVGTEVAFPNADLEEHNVFSPSDPAFDLGRYSKNKTGKSRMFKDPGEMAIFCDIHPTMTASVKVVESAWIAPVGSDGAFVLAHVPPGKYKVVAWTPNSKEVKSPKTIVVTERGTVAADELHLQLGEWKSWHLRKDGTPYPCQPGYKC